MKTLSDALLYEADFDKAYAYGRAKGLTHKEAINYARTVITMIDRDRIRLEEIFKRLRSNKR